MGKSPSSRSFKSSVTSRKGDSHLNFTEEVSLDSGAQASVVEWLQGTFKDIEITDFNDLYDGEV